MFIGYLDGWTIPDTKPIALSKGANKFGWSPGGPAYEVTLLDRDWDDLKRAYEENEDDEERRGCWAEFWIYSAISEKAIDLYGFTAKEDRDVFHLLISVAGIGPKLALAILSHHGREQLAALVYDNDAKGLAQAKGISVKGATKLILELKNKLPNTEYIDRSSGFKMYDEVAQDAIDALRGLKFRKRDAEAALARVVREQGEGLGNASIQDIITACLAVLKKGKGE